MTRDSKRYAALRHAALLLTFLMLELSAPAAGLLPPPTLTYPSDTAMVSTTTPTFQWSSVTGADTGYRIMVATSPGALQTDPTVDTCVGPCAINAATATGVTSYTPQCLAPNTKYYWEVHGRSSSTYGTWSSASTFTTGSVAGPPCGVDVSSDQGTIYWANVQSSGGGAFAYVRATGINLTGSGDTEFTNNMDGSHAVGIPAGAYHFAYPRVQDPSQAANHFVDVAGPYITAGYLRPALDIEDDPTTGMPPLDWVSLSAWIQTWMTVVQTRTGVQPIIYLQDGYQQQLTSVSQYALWAVSPVVKIGPDPTVAIDPGNWSASMLTQFDWDGSVPGISGGVDRDVFTGASLADIMIGGPPPPALVSPSNGYAFPSGTTTLPLMWSTVANAGSYNVQVWTGGCGGTYFTGATTPSSVTSWSVSGLTDGGTYFWQVQVVGANGSTSSFSDCFSFSIAQTPVCGNGVKRSGEACVLPSVTPTNTQTTTPTPTTNHTVTITSGPSGNPNPVQPAGTVNLSVSAIDSSGLPVTYSWSAGCSVSGVASTFSNPNVQSPTWVAPANVSTQNCTICVIAAAGDKSNVGCYTQAVAASPGPSSTPTKTPTPTPNVSQQTPTVFTYPASNVGAYSATLTARVNPNGSNAVFYFEYGRTLSYGTQVSFYTACSNSFCINSIDVTGLACNTIYHFQACGTSSGGTSCGSDQVFTTAACIMPTPTPFGSFTQMELAPTDPAPGDHFGSSAAFSADGNTMLIGAYNKMVNGHQEQGAVYVFVRNGTAWMQQAELTALDGASDDLFGLLISP